MQSNIIPDQEYLLQGSILDSHVEVLKHRLRGLCDNVDGGTETFAEREMAFSIRGTGSTPLNLRVRRPLLDHPPQPQSQQQQQQQSDVPWQLRYIGQPELGNRPTIVRSCYDIACSDNVVDFLQELGCRLEFEYIAKGFIFHKGRLKVTLSKIMKVSDASSSAPAANGGGASSSEQALTLSHLVELSVLAPSGANAIAEDMKNFAEQLRPLVMLDKVDPRKAL